MMAQAGRQAASFDSVLSIYPLSLGYRTRLEALLGTTPVYLTLAALRTRSFLSMLRALVGINAPSLYLALEDSTSRALLPVLALMGAITRARHLHSVDENWVIEPVSRLTSVRLAALLMLESVQARIALVRCSLECKRLSEDRGLPFRRQTGNRLLYLNANLWFGVKAGGSVGHISGVANAFQAYGYDMDFASAGGRLMVREPARYLKLAPPARFGLPVETIYYRYSQQVVDQLLRHYGPNPPDLLYQRMSIANYSGIRLARQWRIPLIIEYNGSEAWVAKHWGRPLRYHGLAEKIELACIRQADLVVTVSDVLREELLARGVEAARIVVYPNCIDPVLFDPDKFDRSKTDALRARWGVPSNAVLVTFIGTFGQWHGVEVFAQAISEMVTHSREWLAAKNVRFMLVGDGLKMPAVHQVLDATPGAAEFSILTGLVPQPEAAGYLAMSDILVSPHVQNPDGSRFFGSPTKLFEYMAMGKGIVASSLDQIADVLAPVDRGEAGVGQVRELAILTTPGDVQDLVCGIRRLVDQPDLRHAMGRNARARALERYTWDRHVAEIMAAYKNVS